MIFKSCFLFLFSVVSFAQSIGPWASAKDVPKVWYALHGAYLTPSEQAAVAESTTIAQVVATPQASLTVSFSAQGSAALKTMVGKTIIGVGMHDLIICAPFSGTTVSAGAIYQLAIANGIVPISPGIAKALFTRTSSLSKEKIAFSAIKYGLLGVPILGQAGVISMSSKVVVALLSAHSITDELESTINGVAPDPTVALNELLDPGATLTFTGSCKEALMITRYTGPKTTVSGTFSLYTH